MDTVQMRHYLNAVEALVCQWDDIVVDTTDAIIHADRHLAPIRRVRFLSRNLLECEAPQGCAQLRADFLHMVASYNELVFVAFIDYDLVPSARCEYLEALTSIHAEIIRLRDRHARSEEM